MSPEEEEHEFMHNALSFALALAGAAIIALLMYNHAVSTDALICHKEMSREAGVCVMPLPYRGE